VASLDLVQVRGKEKQDTRLVVVLIYLLSDPYLRPPILKQVSKRTWRLRIAIREATTNRITTSISKSRRERQQVYSRSVDHNELQVLCSPCAQASYRSLAICFHSHIRLPSLQLAMWMMRLVRRASSILHCCRTEPQAGLTVQVDELS
jgi:hypothetical protein